MPLLMYFFFIFFRLWLGFADFLCLFNFFVSFVSVALLCQRSMSLWMYLFFCACGSVLQTFYASLLYFSFLLRL